MANQGNAMPVYTIASFLDFYDPVPGPEHLNRHNGITSITYNETSSDKQHAQYDDSIWIKPLVQALKKCVDPSDPFEITCSEDSKYYDGYVAETISNYQRKYLSGKINLGVLDDETLNSILQLANSISPDNIEDDESNNTDDTSEENNVDNSPHYNSFFSEQNLKQFRQNHKNIKIVFGNSGIVKEIHDVVMRSVGVEVDTSGNPISETYEFIARDITETDEAKDLDNYMNNNGVSPSDIKYKFNFK